MDPLKLLQHRRTLQTLIVLVIASTFHPSVYGYLDVNQYCKAFDVNFRPIICILKNGTQIAPQNPHPSHPPPPPPPPPQYYPTQYPILQPPVDYIDIDDDDDECSCEVTCIPRIVNQRSLQSRYYHDDFLTIKRFKRTTTTSYRCRSCGTECPVSTTRQPTCNCVIPATRSECKCTATCATFRFNSYYFQTKDDIEDANCILSVTALEDWRLGEERPPYICECKRSKEAEDTTKPDFICVCQRDSSED